MAGDAADQGLVDQLDDLRVADGGDQPRVLALDAEQGPGGGVGEDQAVTGESRRARRPR
jgi:hypothetical protein